ncbi:MAG: hypothetical protein Q9163_001924 [Psora crenata]
MASYYYNPQQQHQPSSVSSHSSSSSHNHHGTRSRRVPRLSASQSSHRQFRGVRSMKELTESPNVTLARARFESARSFDLDDDYEFCRALLTEDDVSTIPARNSAITHRDHPLSRPIADMIASVQYESINSSSTDGSLSSGSPQASPLQNQTQPSPQVTPSFSLNSASANNYNPATGFQSNIQNQQHTKIHQPAALRSRNAIPIVNPQTGMRLPSPPSSVSPAMQQQQAYQRRW